jgi:hypothetical protein
VVKVPTANLLAMLVALLQDTVLAYAYDTVSGSMILGSTGVGAASFFFSSFLPFLGGSGYLCITLSIEAIAEPVLKAIEEILRAPLNSVCKRFC